MAELNKKYTGKFQVLWDNRFCANEQIEHSENNKDLESSQEKKTKMKAYTEWPKNQVWNLEEQDLSLPLA